MTIYITLHSNRMFVNLRNFIRKILKKNYSFLKRIDNQFVITVWNDKYGCYFDQIFKPRIKVNDTILEIGDYKEKLINSELN